MQCREICSVFRLDHWDPKSAQLYKGVTEQICRQKVTHNIEEGPKQHKNISIRLFLKYHEYDEAFPGVPSNVADKLCDIQWDDVLITKLMPRGYF